MENQEQGLSRLPVVVMVCIVCQSAIAQDAVEAVRDQAVVESLLRLDDETVRTHPSIRSAVLRHLDRRKGTADYLEIIEALDIRENNDELLAYLCSDPPSTISVAAARLLLKFQDVERIQAALKNADDTKASAAVTAFGLLGTRTTLNLLKPLVTQSDRSRAVRTASVTALGRSRSGQRYLLELLQHDRLSDDLEFAVANALLGSRSAEIRVEAAKHVQLPSAASTEPIPPIARLTQTWRGDVAKGKTVFNTIGTCAKCHKVRGEGKEVGPDLSEIGGKLSREALYVSILDPSAGISHNYETYNLVTEEGLVLSGVLVSQTDDNVTIKTAEAVERTVPRETIEQLEKQPTSLMPADLHKAMSVQNLVDLVEYMVMLKNKRQVPFQTLVNDQLAGDTVAAVSREPQDAVAGIDVAQGLDVTLFAAEPMLLSPSNIDVDHAGRIWACELVNYRHFRNANSRVREQGDRIMVLEDTDGDGQADKSTVFYQGRDIDSPHGICVLGEKVIVSAGDSVFIFTDENGDLKADSKEVLFTGISGVQHDHGIHAFVFGPDGKLYFNFGNEGRQIKDSRGRPIIDLAGHEVNSKRQPYQQGMVFRCNLDGSELETLAWNFRNNWEICVDSFGTLWQSDNDDDGNRAVRINHVMEFGNYGYCDEMTGAGWREKRTGMHEEIPLRHWHLNDPGVVPNLLQTGAGSPTGILVYEGRLLPRPLRNQIIHCDAGPNIVRAYQTKRNGAGYTARVVNILEGSRDKWFRPSDVCVAPDGSLFVADWYDPGVGGHLMGDTERGRIFRIVPSGHTGYTVPVFDFDSAAGAMDALKNPNLAVRYMAWTALHDMGDRAESVLLAAFQQARRPRLRARALWILGNISGRGKQYVQMAIDDKNANIRIAGIRLARQLRLDLIPLARQLVHDRSPQVRREVAISLRHNSSPAAAAIWASLAQQHDGKDRWYLEALGVGADRQWDKFFAEWLELVGSDWKTPAGRDIVWRSRASAACGLLADILIGTNMSSEEQLRYFRSFDFHRGKEKEKALRAILTRIGHGETVSLSK